MYEHDIFLSYARRNNVAGWVTEFRNALENALREKPDVQKVSIFMDEKDISGGEAYDRRISGSLTKSAVLVIIVSEASLDVEREWCNRERQEFLRHIGGEKNAGGRIYLVNYDGIEPIKLPEEIRRFTPYTFYERDRTTDDIRPGALIDQKAGRFHTELYNLRRDLLEAFRGLGAPSLRRDSQAAADTPRGSQTTPIVENGGAVVEANYGANIQTKNQANRGAINQHRPTVFLAEVIPGKVEQEQFAQLESALMQRVAVVPGRRSYYSAHDGFEDELDKQLQQSDLFVQLLSTQRWPSSSKFQQGYERWLYDRALALNIPIIRWRSGDMDIRSIDAPSYLDFLNLDEPKICDLSEFIPLVFDELEKKQNRKKFKAGAEAFPILLMADRCDEALCNEVGGRLEDLGSISGGGRSLEPEMVLLSDDDGVELVAEADCLSPKGLVVVWESGSEIRLQTLLKQCRRYRRIRELDPPSCAIFVPSEKAHRVNRRPPRFSVVNSDNQHELENYVKCLCGGSL